MLVLPSRMNYHDQVQAVFDIIPVMVRYNFDSQLHSRKQT
jgi:hypothetical protein